MFKVVIIDDEIHAQEIVEMYLNRFFPNKFSVEAKCFSVEEGIKEIKVHKPDLVFLDIQMPDQGGFSLLEHFGKQLEFEVIFTTAHQEYALKAIKHQALDYLLKPINPDEFSEAIAKFESKIEGTSVVRKVDEMKEHLASVNIICFTTQDGIYYFDYDEILYFKSDQSYTRIYKVDGSELLVSKSLGSIEKKLPQNQFFRIHHSIIVNIKKIERYDKKNNLLYLKNGEALSVSVRKSPELIKYFA